MLLLDRRSNKITITGVVIKAAAGNSRGGTDVRWGNDITVVKAARMKKVAR